eukprot:UN25799
MTVPGLIKNCREVLSRCQHISGKTQDIGQLGQMLIRAFDKNTKKLLEETAGLIPELNSGNYNQPNLLALRVIATITPMADLLEKHVTDEIIPKIKEDENTATNCSDILKIVIGTLETEFERILKRLLDEFVKNAHRILKQLQTKKDYIEMPNSDGSTNACASLCSWLMTVQKSISASLTGKNYDIFAHVFGFQIYDILIDRFS